MKLIESNHDWLWHKRCLDANARYEHRHIGEPERFPCKVESTWEDDPNGPYTYRHHFFYQKDVACEKCGHIHYEWEKPIDKF